MLLLTRLKSLTASTAAARYDFKTRLYGGFFMGGGFWREHYPVQSICRKTSYR